MWFFHLRAEDLPRLKAEWFAEGAGNKQVICTLQVTKRDRNKEITENADQMGTSSGSDSARGNRRVTWCCPQRAPRWRPREEFRGRDIRDLFNHEITGPTSDYRPRLSPMQVRHTAFRLIVEEDPRYYRRQRDSPNSPGVYIHRNSGRNTWNQCWRHRTSQHQGNDCRKRIGPWSNGLTCPDYIRIVRALDQRSVSPARPGAFAANLIQTPWIPSGITAKQREGIPRCWNGWQRCTSYQRRILNGKTIRF